MVAAGARLDNKEKFIFALVTYLEKYYFTNT